MIKRQSAAIPYRVSATGDVEVLLVTSKRKRRWVLPKGKLQRWMLAHASAAVEAFEEAGVLGVVERLPVATYRQRKSGQDGASAEIVIDAYPLRVNTELRSWPEKAIRQRRWVTIEDAMNAVRDTELRSALSCFKVPGCDQAS